MLQNYGRSFGNLSLYFAFLAGFIDSVAGGGGLIRYRPCLFFSPKRRWHLLGTNKLASIAGTSIAVVQYARHVGINWRATLPTIYKSFVLSFLPARTTTILNTVSNAICCR